MKNLFLLLSITLNTVVVFSQNLTINIVENQFGIDEKNGLIVSHIEGINNYTNTSTFNDITIVFNQNSYYFNSIPNSLQYSDSYLVTEKNTSKQYTLYFTQLPIISIQSNNTIVDEPKVLAEFTYSDDEQVVVSNIGIEIRGGVSQKYPKKTYDLEFWEDETGEDNVDIQFGNLRSDDDWVLDALYNEPLRLRSFVAHKLWLKMQTPEYLEDEPEAKSGADVMYAEMFLNGEYNGLYNISEQVDKKQLKLKSFKDDAIRGELYKGTNIGATTFKKLPNYNNTKVLWGGYEIKHPDEDDIIDWSNLYEFTDFVMNSSNVDFTNNIWSKFDVDNYSNYFLFLNLLRATDNTGKNLYVAKYNTDTPYFYVPWDLDGCFGTIFNGTNANITNDIIGNGFMDRVTEIDPDNVLHNTSTKWFNFRETIFKMENLSNSITIQYNYLQNNKVYEREAIVYPNYTFSEEDLSYTLNWLTNRFDYLDEYFGSTLSTINNAPTNKTSFIYPNPAKDKIYIANSNLLIQKEFKIYNNLGQLISKGILDNDFVSIEKLKIGYYLIIIDNTPYKFIKE